MLGVAGGVEFFFFFVHSPVRWVVDDHSLPCLVGDHIVAAAVVVVATTVLLPLLLLRYWVRWAHFVISCVTPTSMYVYCGTACYAPFCPTIEYFGINENTQALFLFTAWVVNR